jgi:hypothetical protein
MKEVYPNLYCGCDKDYPPEGDNWSVVHAAREPYHRKLGGYKTPDAPPGDSYWKIRDGDRLAANLVDVEDERFYYEDLLALVEDILDFIEEELDSGKKVLVHCNKGTGRAPLICMAFIAHRGLPIYGKDFDECEEAFKEVYPEYNPKPGFRNFLRNRWNKLEVNSKKPKKRSDNV